MATVTNAVGPSTVREVNGTPADRIESKPHLTHTTTNISMTPEMFEKLYLTPKIPHAVDHAARFANAAPLGFLGYVRQPFLR
jgi:hypothetical protein